MRALCLLIAGVLLPTAAGETVESRTCEKQRLCLEAVANEDDSVVFRAVNPTDYPVALRLRVWPENLVSERGDRITTTVPGGETLTLLSYQPKRAGERTWYRYLFRSNYGRHDVRHEDDYRYRPPYESGKRFRILQGYGSRFSHVGNERHTVDFDMPVGTPVHAARDGVVVDLVSHQPEGCWASRCADKANYVVVLHDDGSTGEYYHLVRDGVLVEVGQRVERGERIALSGNSGHSTMPHLHFGVYEVDDDGRTLSIPVVFDTDRGPVDRPRPGRGFAPIQE